MHIVCEVSAGGATASRLKTGRELAAKRRGKWPEAGGGLAGDRPQKPR